MIYSGLHIASELKLTPIRVSPQNRLAAELFEVYCLANDQP